MTVLDLTPYRTPTELNIPAESWAVLKAEHDTETIAQALCDATEGMPMPDATITRDQAMAAFEALRAAPLHELLDAGSLTLLRSSSAAQPDYHTRLRPPGNAASNHFFHTLRLRTPKSKFPSAWQKWHDSGLRLEVCRRLFQLKHVKFISNVIIRWALHMTGATPAQFKPGVAKAVYEITQAERVLDFSMGWGDRLAGFCASAHTRYYMGIDPNPELHPLYYEQVRMYGAGKEFYHKCAAAEDVAMGEHQFDLVFTSPPYFGIERYAAGTGNEADQSWSRHPTANQWREGFLRPVLGRAWEALRPGGILAINIADINERNEAYPLCDWLKSIVGGLSQSQYKFTLGMRLQGANYSGERRQQISGEPIWFWSKGDRDLPTSIIGVQSATTRNVAQAGPQLKRNRGSPATSQTIVDQVLKDYDDMLGGTTIARKYGIDKRTVYNILIRNGRKLRPRSNRKGESTSTPTSIVAGLNRSKKEKPQAEAQGFSPSKFNQ